MDTMTAWRQVKPLVHVRFEALVSPQEIPMMRRNKGMCGQVIERTIGLSPGSRLLDFTDGDLKTYKCDAGGHPEETMQIHQVGDEIDELVEKVPFRSTNLYRKTSRFIVLGICKQALDPARWFISIARLVDARPGTHWFAEFEASYRQILEEFDAHLARTGSFHTSNGALIQLRTKDAMPYRPLVSRSLGRQICGKNIAFYFRKAFMERLLQPGAHAL